MLPFRFRSTIVEMVVDRVLTVCTKKNSLTLVE